MAAIDPSAEPEDTGITKTSNRPRATLKMVYDPAGLGDEDDSEDEDDEENFLKKLLAAKGDDGDEVRMRMRTTKTMETMMRRIRTMKKRRTVAPATRPRPKRLASKQPSNKSWHPWVMTMIRTRWT